MVMCEKIVCVARSTSRESAVEWATKGRCGASGIAIGRCRTPHEHAKSVPIIAEKQKKLLGSEMKESIAKFEAIRIKATGVDEWFANRFEPSFNEF